MTKEVTNRGAETVGIAEKVSWPSSVIFVAALVVMFLDLFNVIDVDDAIWLALYGAAGVNLSLGFAAPPPVTRD